MGQKNILIAVLIIVFIGGIGYFAFVKNQTPVIEEKVLEMTLEVTAPSSTAKLIIYEDGSALYSEKHTGQVEQQGIYEDVDTATRDLQMRKFSDLVIKNKFFSLGDTSKGANDPDDGSTYTMTITRRSAVHKVSCYQFRCEPGFMEIQNEMRAYFKSYWGKEVLEVGV